MSGIFCDVVSGDSPYFGFSVQFEKKESHVKQKPKTSCKP